MNDNFYKTKVKNIFYISKYFYPDMHQYMLKKVKKLKYCNKKTGK